MAARGRDVDRGRAGGVGALVLATFAVLACYPNPDDLRVDRSGIGSGGHSSGGSSGAGGHTGAGGAVGAGGASAMCGAPACGGNLLGTWTFVNSCVGTLPVNTCAGATVDGRGTQRAGTLTFNSNGTYSQTETDTGTFILDAPTSCLGGGTCADLQTAYLGPGFVGAPNPTLSSATCSTTATGCRCLLGALGTPLTDTGTYVASGTSITATSSTGGVSPDTYCVVGSTLHMIYSDSTPPTGIDELTLMKQ